MKQILVKSVGLRWLERQFDQGKSLTAADVEAALHVSRRTAERWLNDLSQVYPLTNEPVRSENPGQAPWRWFRVRKAAL